jgi:hypothetical protein
MLRNLRSAFAALALVASGSAAFAAASNTPTNYQPDPALKTASRSELETRVRKTCTITQARLRSAPESSFSRPCGCYAARTLRSFSETELQAYRDTGVFNEGARAKALAALDECRLERPI